MPWLIALLILSTFRASAVFVTIDRAPIFALVETLRTFPRTAEFAKPDLRRLFKAIRENHEALREPTFANIIKNTLVERLDADELAWWNLEVDRVIDRMAAYHADLARSLKCIAAEENGSVKPGWRNNLDAIAAFAILIPISLLTGGHVSTGLSDLAKLGQARDVLTFREVIKAAHAAACVTDFGPAPTAPNP